jgi:hypothetical protein
MSFAALREVLSIFSEKVYFTGATESLQQLTIPRCLPQERSNQFLTSSDRLYTIDINRERPINTFCRRDQFAELEFLQQLMVESTDVFPGEEPN